MHEASIANSILQIVTDKLSTTPHSQAARRVHIIVGAFRNVDLDSLQFAFDNLRGLYHGCVNCELEADMISARAICLEGNHKYSPDFAHAFRCPVCQGPIGKLLCGEELDVITITLEANPVEANSMEGIFNA